MKSKNLSLKAIINESGFLKKTVIIQWEIRKKDLQLLAIKFAEEIPDPRNAKEHYHSFMRKKNTKSVK